MNRFGLSASQIGFVLGIGSLILALADYPSGNLADLYGRRKIGAAGFAIWGGGLLIYGFSRSFVGFTLASSIMGIGLALISGTPQSWYVDQAKAAGMSEKIRQILPVVRGVALLVSATSGFLAGMLLRVGPALPIICAAGVALVTAIFYNVSLPENYGNPESRRFLEVIIENTTELFKSGHLRVLLIKLFFSQIAYSIFILSWQISAIQMGLPLSSLGPIFVFIMLAMSVSSFAASWLMGRVNPLAVSLIGLGMTSMGGLIIFSAHGLLPFLVGLACYELGLGLDSAAYGVWVHEYIPSERRSSFLSAFSSFEGITEFFVFVLAGWLVESLGYVKGWLAIPISEAIAFTAVVSFIKLTPKISPGEETSL